MSIRYAFGENWRRFSRSIDEGRIESAIRSIEDMTGSSSLAGKTFLDVGSGSGLFSLAAHRLGASVVSFDNDPQSVTCTKETRERYRRGRHGWSILEHSALEPLPSNSSGPFDIVYSWGVLHHTGEMYLAIDSIVTAIKPGGLLLISIYNDQGLLSRYWRTVKRLYNKSRIFQAGIIVLHAPYLFGLRFLVRAATCRLRLERGMSMWHDMLDWLGGYPFEVAKPEEIIERVQILGFSLQRLKTCGGRLGCNEFVFRKKAQSG